jgi:O-antigen/teichoic acid export membrane protein
LRGLVATNAIVAVVTGGLNIAVARRLFPELRLGLFTWTDRQMMRQIFSFSWKIQASNISQLLIFQVDRILLSRYLGLEAVAFYEIGSNAAFYAKSFLSVLFAPMVPAASALQATNDHELIGGLYKRSFKFMVLLAVPFTLLVMAAAVPFIRIWMGPGFALSALTLQLLMPAYLINILTGPGTFILNGINRPDIGMRAACLAGGTNLVLCLVLVLTFGYFGLIAGISISLAVSAVYFISLFHRTLPEIGRDLYRRVLFKPIAISAPAAILLYAADRAGYLPHLPALLAGMVIYAATVGFLLLRSGYLDAFEQRIFFGLLPFKSEGR